MYDGGHSFFSGKWPESKKSWVNFINIVITVVVVVFFLTKAWVPLGAQNSLLANFIFVIVIVAIILGLLSQDMSSEDVAVVGVYLHGLAGDIAAKKKSEVSLVAGDIIKYFGSAIKTLSSSLSDFNT